jgi:hypothetical protein
VCAREVYIAESGDGGQGIKVQKGDKFVIPPGWLTISLDPKKSRGRLARHGLSWFVEVLIFGEFPRETEGIPALLQKWEKEADDILRASDKLAGLSIDDEQDGERIVEIVTQYKGSLEWWALLVGLLAQRTQEQIKDEGDLSQAVLSALRTASAWAMFVYLRDLDAYVWTGYQHTQLIYGIATAASQTPAEAEAIDALRPIFEGLSEQVLHTWVEAGVDIGPRIGVTTVDEDLLRALAKYHVDLFEQRRKQQQLDREHGSRKWNDRFAGASAGAAVVGVVVAALKAFGVL